MSFKKSRVYFADEEQGGEDSVQRLLDHSEIDEQELHSDAPLLNGMSNSDENQRQKESDCYSSSFDEQQAEDLLLSGYQRRKGFNWICCGFLSILGLAWILWTMSVATIFTGLSSKEIDQVGQQDDLTANGLKKLQFNDLFNSSFHVRRTNLVWIENGMKEQLVDNNFSGRDTNTKDILKESVEDRKSQIFVEAKDLVYNNRTLEVASFALSFDAEYMLLRTNMTPVWRHSSLFIPYLYRVSDKKITPLIPSSLQHESEPVKISYAAWSPTGHLLAYVLNNNLYIADIKSKQHKQITFDGSQNVFNGIPDWVYEEEVLASNYALWWSPDASSLAYLRLDETNVPEFHLSMYTGMAVDKTNSSTYYPKENIIRYPKAGAPNPIVSLHVYSLDKDKTLTATSTNTKATHSINILNNKDSFNGFDEQDRIIVDVAWASPHFLLFKQMNRVQDHQYTCLVRVDQQNLERDSSVKLIREYQPKDGGWIDVTQSMVYLPLTNTSKDAMTSVQFLDVLDNKDGYPHLAIVNYVLESSSSQINWLTSGNWEVVPESVRVDAKRQLIHYMSTERSPYERHLYRLSYSDGLKEMTAATAAGTVNEEEASTVRHECLTCPEDPEEHSYYSVASFSPKSGYYVLNYEGPGVPNTTVQKVMDNLAGDVGKETSKFDPFVLQDNAELKALLKEYDLPKTHMKPVPSGGVEMMAMEIVPADFDVEKKYPVLFHVYGGPSSQLVSYRFELNWQTFVASQLGFIVVTVDGRGTGFRGRDYRVGVRGRLGELEVIDQLNAGRFWSKLDYVDSYRMAIWGWSYGGYMTTKVVEANDGVFSTGMAVAPVTDWRFYDSIYTERYMKTPALNPKGYERSAVNNMTGFQNTQYLLAHGTGDDNVHFQHSAVLLDKLTLADVHNYRVQVYPDSNHAITHHNANKNVYYLLTDFLIESFGGHSYKHIYNEMHGRFSGPLPKET